MGLFAGLCTLFALVVTVGEGWQEHVHAQWPAATARIQSCGLGPVSSRRNAYYGINCRLSYLVGSEQIEAKVYSRSIPAPQRVIWQYPPNQIGTLQQWVDEHPEGTPITVHYDPDNPRKAVLVETDMPLGGPQTANNLKLLGFAAASCVLLLTIARFARPRSSS